MTSTKELSDRSGGMHDDSRWQYVELEQVDSTNADALRRAADGERGPLWLRADRQTKGRGRSGRAWQSEAGNLTASLLFQPNAPVRLLHQLSLVAGVAAADALQDLAPPDAARLVLKWPNDLLLGDAKAGGILVESSTYSGDVVAVIGIGLNVAIAPIIEACETADLTAVLAPGCSLDNVIHKLALRMDHWLSIWNGGKGFASIRTKWLEHGTAPGERVSVQIGGQATSGFFESLDNDGALLMRRPSGAVERFTFGDVTLMP